MQQKQVSEKLLLTGIVVSMALWGLSWPSAKVLTHYCSVANFTVYRYLLVIVTLLIILFFSRTSLLVQKAGFATVLVSGVLLALYSYVFYMGLKNGSAGAGGVLVTTLNPIISYSINIIWKRSVPSRNEAMGLVLGLIAGCVLLKVWSSAGTLLDSGNLYFLLASFTWALMSKFTSKATRYGSSMGFSTWQYTVTLLCLLPMLNVPEMQAVFQISNPWFWANMFFSSVVVTAMATTFYFYATTRLGAEKASSFIFMVPLGAAISSWLLLDEHILPHTIVGGVLGLVAVYMINKRK